MALRFALLALALVLIAPARAQSPLDEPSATTPDTPVGRQLAWIMTILHGAQPNEADIRARFTPGFLEDAPAAAVAQSLLAIRDHDLGGQPIRLLELEGNSTDYSLSGFVAGPRRKMSVYVNVHDETGLISGLRFGRAGYLLTPVGDWDAFTAALGRIGGSLSFGAYEIIEVPPRDAGAPEADERSRPTARLVPIHQIEDHLELAVASTFKVFVLGALAEQTIAGSIAWGEKLPIREDLKSLPATSLQRAGAGEEFAIAFVAERMISISDNTAADHLLARVGRERVEAFFSRYARHPRRTLPFLSTREMFRLKIPADETLLERYLAADEDAQRALLAPDGPVAKVPLDANLREWDAPVRIDELEWFASAHGVARALADLKLLAARDARAARQRAVEDASPDAPPEPEATFEHSPLWAALTKNPGLRFDRGTWTQIGYKGGSEPGVLSMNWIVQRDDGRWFALAIAWNNPEEPLEDDRLTELARKGFELLQAHGREKPAAPDAPPSP